MGRTAAKRFAGLSPRAVWDQLGAEGRQYLQENARRLIHGSTATWYRERRASQTLVISGVETMTCAPDILERVAADWGCTGVCCTRQWTLQSKPALHENLAAIPHAIALLLAFLHDPDLAFPPDIPEYAIDSLDTMREKDGVIAARMRRQAALQTMREEAQKRAAVAKAQRESRVGRIAKREVQIARLQTALQARQADTKEQIRRLKAAEKSIETRITRAQRSLAALRRLEEKKP